ncbi:ATP-binding protein [Pseudonocardia sp.]|jgi:anti-sigma regulatory factor (Ser/Thr protein kinase)|uniref:ATP-binding protein n=1 Tax=Pseudonocardia sp. TaxID=60912 RepID=UPI002DA916EA|nr:ATP-binding protein [Pseudonocardia sp.]
MRIETTRSAVAFRLEHAVGYHRSDADLLAQLVPLAAAAIERGEPVAVALRPGTDWALHEELGRPPGLIPLSRPQGSDSASGQTVAARRALELRELTSTTGGPVTLLTEHITTLDGADGSFWTEFDAAVNVALAELPVRMTCFYPELPLHLEILDGSRRNHPLLLVGGQMLHNPEHLYPRDVLAMRPAPAPALLGPPDVRMTFSAWQLHEVRSAVEGSLLEVGYGRTRAEDLVLAVNEVATNAVEHGAPEAELAIWTGNGGELVCEVHDHGVLADPLPGLQAPHPSDPRGRGVWIARQLCDSLHVWADRRGTHVRMHATP